MNRSLARRSLYLGLACLAGFALVAIFMRTGAALSMDLWADGSTVAWRQGSPRQAAELAASLGNGSVLIPLAGICGLLLIVLKRYPLAPLPALALIASVAMNQLLKCGFLRTRPSGELWDSSITECDRYSFPSGHAMETAAVYGTLALLAYKLAPGAVRAHLAGVLAVIPLLAGLSRVALGVHWASDVAAGWLAGAAVAFLLMAVWCRRPGVCPDEPPGV